MRSWNQRIAAILGSVYLLVGAAGFVVTGFGGFVDRVGGSLLGFQVNPLHNVVHLGIGIALLAASLSGPAASRTMNFAVGGVYLVVGLVGLFLLGSEANVLALNHPDNLLHLGTAAVLLAVASTADHVRASRPTRAAAVRTTGSPAPVLAGTQTEPVPAYAEGEHTMAAETLPDNPAPAADDDWDYGEDWEDDDADWDEPAAQADDWQDEAESTQAMSAAEIAQELDDDWDEEWEEEEAEAPPATLTQQPADDLSNLTKEELYQRAQDADIQGRSAMTKEELVEALRAAGG